MVYGGGSENNLVIQTLRERHLDSLMELHPSTLLSMVLLHYIDGGDRGTVKLFSYGTPTNIDVFGLKRTFTTSGTGGVTLGSNSEDTTDPFITGGSTSGLGNSYCVGAKITTSDPLDQNIEVTYVDTVSRRLYLNSPLNNGSLNTIDIIPNRVTPLVGIKCRDFIQVAPVRM